VLIGGAMKYAKATWWIFVSWGARKARLPMRWVHDLEDNASMAMFVCSLDFEPVDVVIEKDAGRSPPGIAAS
jgi:hypothetical protein